LAELRALLGSLELPPKKRRRLLWRIAKHGLITVAKRHQRNQSAPDGTPWAPRKRGKGKMLRKLPRLMAVHEMPGQDAVKVYFRGGSYTNGRTRISAGAVGWTHHNGAEIRVSADSFGNQDQRGQTATRRQAKRLRALGCRVRRKGRWRKASLQYLLTLPRAQAGLLITLLTDPVPRQKPRTWTITLPSRVFLGVTDEEFSSILARQLSAIGYGLGTDAQDIR
ncbi:phage virion morphogenesis protein, partial [Escherichia coli]|nr:phage virion morphogenesis protein [Escherichia coli]